MKPVILITTDRRDLQGLKPGPRVRPCRPEAWISELYVGAVRSAGGVAILAPPGGEDEHRLLQIADGVVLTGGHFDIHPSLYGEAVAARLDRVEPTRTSLELAVAAACLDRDIPVLGICGGEQALAVAAGGRLHQDIGTQVPGALEHEQPDDPVLPSHGVRMAAAVTQWTGEHLEVNSTHHQAVREISGTMEACGWAPDGVIEAIWAPGHRFALGVQWHPELLCDLRVYNALIAASKA